MEHEEKCPTRYKDKILATTCTYCQIIRSVRSEYETE